MVGSEEDTVNSEWRGEGSAALQGLEMGLVGWVGCPGVECGAGHSRQDKQHDPD